MKKLILTIGMSCSGKTTWAEEFIRNRSDWVNLNRDDVRFTLFTEGERNWEKYKFNKKNEKRVSSIIDGFSEEAVAQGCNIIVSDTNLNVNTRNKWESFAGKYDYIYEEKPFIIDWDTARKRNQQREGGISESVLWSQYLRMNEYLGRKTYKPDTSKPSVVLVDVDGTIADMKGVRKPFQWDRVKYDKPRTLVVNMLKGLMYEGIAPIFLSGRDGVCMDDTYEWIKHNVMDGGNFYLFMRESNDSRKDKIVKEEIFWKYVANNFNVVGAIEDRASVLQLWRELNIPNIIDVSGDRYYEF